MDVRRVVCVLSYGSEIYVSGNERAMHREPG
jgi:hypothetical protein